MKKYKIALFIGRFQPLHNGHVYGIKKTLAIAEKVIVVIGSSREAGTENNPFDFEARKKMIAALKLPNTTVVGLPDYASDEVWLSELVKLVGKFDLVASNNDWVLSIMKAAGYKTFETGLFRRDELEGVKIRGLLRSGDTRWRGRVPEQVARQIDVFAVEKSNPFFL
jgi:nicotinamide-nucleotide adenylyltransferase